MPNLRDSALALALAEIGTREEGGNNRGVRVEEYLDAVGRWPGVPWCAAFVSWCYETVCKKQLPWTSAGVEVIYREAKKRSWLVDRPFRGDLVLFDMGGGYPPGDHCGFVEKVLALGPLFTLRTIEGNTSSGEAGSQSDGGGVHRRTRVVKKSKIAFVRVPDDGGWEQPPAKKRKRSSE